MKIHWIIFVSLLVLGIQTLIFNRWILKGIEYSRFFNISRVFEGDQVEMVERITNRKILPVPWLRIESKISENLEFERQFNLDIKHEQFHKSLFSLLPFTAINRRHSIKCKKRGYYRLNSAALTTGDLFGFVNKSKTYGLKADLLVYPKIVGMDSIPFPSRSFMGDIIVKRWIIEDPFLYSGVRDYMDGDPLSNINWKATARSGNLMVHKKDYTADPNIMIYLNMDVAENMWGPITEPDLIERGITYAASLMNEAILRGIPTGFGTNGYIMDNKEFPVRIFPENGDAHRDFLFEIMAKLVLDRNITFHTFLDRDIGDRQAGVFRGTMDYLFITAFVSETMESQIKTLEDMGNSVEVLKLN